MLKHNEIHQKTKTLTDLPKKNEANNLIQKQKNRTKITKFMKHKLRKCFK